MKNKKIIVTVSLALSASILNSVALAASLRCSNVMSSSKSNRVDSLASYTTYLAAHYSETAALAKDLTSTSMAPFLKSNTQPAYAPEIKTAIGEFLAPTLLMFSTAYASNQGRTIEVKPLPKTVTVKAVVLTWGEAEDAARALANKRGVQTLRSEQERLALASHAQFEKDKDVTAFYERDKKIMSLGEQIVKILNDSHREAYGELAESPSLRSNRDADKVGIVHSERTVIEMRPDYFGTVYNRLIQLKVRQPDAFDRVVREMNADPRRYFAAVLKKYMAADEGSASVAMMKIRSEFLSSPQDSQILEAFADLTGAILVQRDRFGKMIPSRDGSATHNLGSVLLRALAEDAGVDEKTMNSLSYVQHMVDFASPLGEGMAPY